MMFNASAMSICSLVVPFEPSASDDVMALYILGPIIPSYADSNTKKPRNVTKIRSNYVIGEMRGHVHNAITPNIVRNRDGPAKIVVQFRESRLELSGGWPILITSITRQHQGPSHDQLTLSFQLSFLPS